MKCQPSVIRGRRGDASRLLSTFELTEACCTCAYALSIPQGLVTNHRGLHDSVAAKEARNGRCRSKFFWSWVWPDCLKYNPRVRWSTRGRCSDITEGLQSQADRSESHTAFTRQRPFSTDSAW